MIYTNEARAIDIAAMLNDRRGFPRAEAVKSAAGWTVIASYHFGTSGPQTPAMEEEEDDIERARR
jgi:hypothetical protein